jgi:hypothetical protein
VVRRLRRALSQQYLTRSRRGENGLAMRADAQTEAVLLEILERFCSRFAARNADGVMQLFAPDADVVMVTSEDLLLRGRDEVRAFLRRYAQGDYELLVDVGPP